LGKRQGLVSIGVQSLAMMLTSLLPDILILHLHGNPSVSDMEIEMPLISKLGTVHPYGINGLMINFPKYV
jgi:hypothetical protein